MNDRLSFNQAAGSGMSEHSTTSLKEPDQIDDMRMTHDKKPMNRDPSMLSSMNSMNEKLFEKLDIRSRKSTIEEDEFEESVGGGTSRRNKERNDTHLNLKSNRSKNSKNNKKIDKVDKLHSVRS